MSKRRREADTAADTAELDPVFVDTNLGTHLALLLCDSDTASDFKKKVATEHQKCFPEIGEIEVHSVMVKRRSKYYHLPDIMHVKSAFHGVKSNRFLSVDASKISTCLAIRNSLERGAKSDVKNAVAEPMTVKLREKITDSHSSPYPEEHHVEIKSPAKKKRKVRHSSLEDSNAVVRPNGIDENPNIPDVKVSGERNDQYDVKGRLVSEGTSIPSMEEKFNVENMVDSGLGTDVLPLGAVSITVPESSARMMNAGGGGGDISTTGSKRKKKGVKKTTAEIQNTIDTEQIGKEESIRPSTVEVEEVKGLLLEDDDKVITSSNSKSPDHVGPDLTLKGRLVSEGTSLPSMEKKFNVDSILNSQNLTSTNRTEESNTFESMVDSGLGKDVLPLGAVSITAPESSARMMNAGGEGGDVSTTRSKRKKKGVKKTTAKIQDTTDTEQIGKEESIRPSTVEMEEVKGLLLEDDDKVIMPSNSKSPDHVGPVLALKEASHLQDAEKSKFSIVNSYKHKDSDERKEDNVVESKMDYELDQDVPTLHSSGVCTNTAVLSATMGHAGGGNGDVNSDGQKRKKKKKARKSAKVTDTRDMEQIGEDEVKKPQTETIRSEEMDVSLKHDKVILPSSESNYPDHVDPDLTQKEARVIRDSDAVMEPEISNRTKKKRERKRIGTNAENVGIEEIHMDIGGSLDLASPSGYNISKATGKDENIRLNEGMDVEMKLLDSSGHDAQEKVWELNRKTADSLQTQTEHTLENVTVGNKLMTRKTNNSVGDCHADSHTAETEYTIMESNKVDKDNENTKKKKRRSISTKKEKLGVVEIHKVIGGSLDVPSPSHDHIPLATGKDESIRINGNNARKELLDASNHASEENVLEVNRKEADLVESQTLENVCVLNKMMMETSQSSEGNHHADYPTAEPENPIMESTQTNKDNENGESKYKKSTKKRRKQKHTATVVQEHSQVPSCRNEEKVDEMHELVPNTNGLKENSEKGSEGINFRQYIVADQLQNKADCSDMVRTRSKTRSLRLANTDDVPSANIPINLQNSVKSLENKISENNPYREDTLRTKCDSTHNPDKDETSPNSVRRSLKTSEKQENGRSVLGPKVSGKPSSCKTSSGGSETLHNRRGNALLGRKVSNMMQMKTPKKKISLAKPGGIFQDNSGESSGDDNGTKLSKDRAISPSDSSSMSGDSEGESELSQNSASNGSTGAKAKSFSMFDFSASTEVEMTMAHLKCSDLFKKSMKVAKPIEPIQFDADGQPII